MSVGKMIDSLIKRNKITRLKLSNDTGVPYTTLTQIINGRTKSPQINALEKIADYFSVSLDYLTFGTPDIVEEFKLNLPQDIKESKFYEEIVRCFKIFSNRFYEHVPNDLLLRSGIIATDKAIASFQPNHGVLFSTFLSTCMRNELYIQAEKVGYSRYEIEDISYGLKESSVEYASNVETIAAHHDGEDWTEEELEEIERFKEFVRSKRRKGR